MIASLSVASTAHAQQVVPPGNSAANQYTETFPTTSGDEPTAEPGEGGRTPGEALGTENSRRLEDLGPEGREAAALAAATAPAVEGGRQNPANEETGRRTGRTIDGDSGSGGLGQITGEATGLSTSGAGGPFVILAIAILLVASAAYLLLRNRRTA
jgi:hypothetical protein